MTKESRFPKVFKSAGVRVGLVFLAIIIIIGIGIAWNKYDNREYDESIYTPILVNEKDIVKGSKEQIINSYNNNKESFNKVIEYLSNQQIEYSITNSTGADGNKKVDIKPEIKDANIKQIIEKLVLEQKFPLIMSKFMKTPEDMSIWFFYDGTEGVYQRGVIFLKDEKLKDTAYGTVGNSVWEYQELAPKTYYYYNHFDKVQHEDKFRQIAWDYLKDEDKNMIVNKDKASILIDFMREEGTNKAIKTISITYSIKNEKYKFNDYLKVYIDGKTRKVLRQTNGMLEQLGAMSS